MRKANEQEYDLINAYFRESGFQVNSNETVVYVSDNSKEVAEFIGVDTSNLSYEEILDSLDVQNVWYDGEESHQYYVIPTEEVPEGVRLSDEQWKDIFRNLSEMEEEDFYDGVVDWVEVLWLDSSDEYVLAYGEELFEDGFKTEGEAYERLHYLEQKLIK